MCVFTRAHMIDRHNQAIYTTKVITVEKSFLCILPKNSKILRFSETKEHDIIIILLTLIFENYTTRTTFSEVGYSSNLESMCKKA